MAIHAVAKFGPAVAIPFGDVVCFGGAGGGEKTTGVDITAAIDRKRIDQGIDAANGIPIFVTGIRHDSQSRLILTFGRLQFALFLCQTNLVCNEKNKQYNSSKFLHVSILRFLYFLSGYY